MASSLFFLLLFLFFSFSTPSSSFEQLNKEVEALTAIKRALNDPHGVLRNWDEFSADPCSWAMITCSFENLVIGLGIPSQSLSGTLSASIGTLTNLQQILLQNNNITGEIPPELGQLPKLQTLDLSDNRFSGKIPDALGHLPSLRYLRLNNNSLNSAFPVSLSKVPQLSFLDLSYNNLSGPVPIFPARTFNVVGNPLICGNRTTEECSRTLLSPVSLPFLLDSSHGRAKTQKVAVALGCSLGATSLLLLTVGLVFLWRRKKQRRRFILGISERESDEEGPAIRLGNLRHFGLRELQAATDNFSPKCILGKGGFGNVYRGKLSDGSIVAVKRLKDGGSAGGEAQFKTEVEMISLAVHRNLLRLIGYCTTSKERILVYPYMSNGSVASRLRGKPSLDWNTRKQIALGAARGLLYLHEQCDPKIIHRDVKAANVLLDDCCEAVVGDFGLAKLLDHEDSHVTTAVRGTIGHIAPEYLSTGQSSDRTDVFGFGILLLELITGQRALQFGKGTHQKGSGTILDWVKKLQQEKKVEVLVDRQLGMNYDKMEVGEMVQVALLCTQHLPSQRPKISEVVRMLEGDGLADKWEASNKAHNAAAAAAAESYNDANSTNSCDADNDSNYDLHSMDDNAVEEMELSGPR